MLSRMLTFAIAAGLATAFLSACQSPQAASRITTQNLDNARILALNTHALADLAAAQSKALSDIRLHHARQQTAIALARLLAADEPSLARRRDSLQAQLTAAPLAQREAVFASLAQREPALIDAAAASPGFTLDRILRDSAAADALHIQIDSEHDPVLREALLAQRNALLDPYALVRLAAAESAADSAAIADLRAALDDQSYALLLHATALSDFASAAPAAPAPADLYRSDELRTLLLDSIERSRGRAARDRIAVLLNRTDSAIDIVIND